MLNLMSFQHFFEHFQSMEIKLFILFNTEIGYDFEIQVGNMVQQTASFD